MKSFALLCCCIFFWRQAISQSTPEFIPVAVLEKAVQRLETDELQRLYLIQNDYELVQCDAKGTPLYTFNENTLGPISYIDVRNPFRILVYYDDYATAVFLDRTLSELQRYDLSQLNLPQIQALGMASDNNLWLYDNGTATLKKIDQSDQVLVESLELDLLLNIPLNPIRVLEANNQVYLHDPNIGIMVFDVFGAFIKTIRIPETVTYFQFQDEQLFYTQDNILYSYHPLSLLTQAIQLPILKENTQQVCINQQLLYVRYPNRVELFRLSKK